MNQLKLDVAGYIYDSVTQRYRLPNGRFLSAVATQELNRNWQASIKNDMSQLANLYIKDRAINNSNKLTIDGGTIGIRDFALGFTTLLRDLHIASYALGRGGVARITDQNKVDLQLMLDKQAKYFKKMLLDLKAERISIAQFTARVQQYASGGEAAFNAGRQAEFINNGASFAERRLGRADRHCSDCIYYQSLGRVPIDSVPPPAVNCQCGSMCRCSIRYFTAAGVLVNA